MDWRRFAFYVDNRAGGSGGAGGAIAPPIFLEIRNKVVFSTPNVSGLHE